MYRAPVKDIDFVLHDLLGAERLSKLPSLADYSRDLADSVLEEAARLAQEVLEPLNVVGDREGAKWTAEGVVTPPGFRDAYRQFVDGGWPQLGVPAEHGGQGMPLVLSTAVQEIWASANLAFKLCPMLTTGAVEALIRQGSDEQKRTYLPKMVSGEWTGTMNLTEPQAGSDLAQVRTRAVPDGDHYRIFGQKIFITYGEHDFTPNIIHMVLARIDGAPPGVKGISLFIVPKFLVDANGNAGARNDVHCASIEHKLGIHASPTCVMAYGDREGAIGYLVGEANHGLEYMFIMMNAARLSVGLEGYAVSERAYQRALDWAKSRVQGRAPGAGPQPVPIIQHPDVRRMLMTMRSKTEAMRALALYTALQLDLGEHETDADRRSASHARGDLLIPVVKGWCTETGIELASIGIQVHGGMGYVEETGAAQYLRDVRITTIYEGTTAIQANDLLGRKLARDEGAAMRVLLDEMKRDLAPQADGEDEAMRSPAREAVERLGTTTAALLRLSSEDARAAAAVSVPYLKLCGVVVAGWLMARAAAAAADTNDDAEFRAAKIETARFYMDQVLPEAMALAAIVVRGAPSALATDNALA